MITTLLLTHGLHTVTGRKPTKTKRLGMTQTGKNRHSGWSAARTRRRNRRCADTAASSGGCRRGGRRQSTDVDTSEMNEVDRNGGHHPTSADGPLIGKGKRKSKGKGTYRGKSAGKRTGKGKSKDTRQGKSTFGKTRSQFWKGQGKGSPDHSVCSVKVHTIRVCKVFYKQPGTLKHAQASMHKVTRSHDLVRKQHND